MDEVRQQFMQLLDGEVVLECKQSIKMLGKKEIFVKRPTKKPTKVAGNI